MKIYMVPLLLLLLDVRLYYGHTLSRNETIETEIYEVKEGQSGLLITHPKDEVAKLREIIYYHIIERPYDSKDLSQDKIEPEKSSFTNSHSGIQFEKRDLDDAGDESEELYESSNSTEETVDNSNSNESNKEKDNEQSSDTNVLSKDKINNQDISSYYKYGDNDSITNDKSEEDSPIDADSIQIDRRFSDLIVNTTDGVPKVESATTIITDDPETKTERISDTPQNRRKREINHTVTGNAKSVETGEKLNHATNKTHKREGGTYGMSLAGNSGTVWNDVKPTHIEYHVGEPEALTTSRPDVMAEDITTSKSPTEPEVIQEIDDDNDEEDELIETFAEIEKIFDKVIDNMDKVDKSERKLENKRDGASGKSRDAIKQEDDSEHDNEDSYLDPIEIEKSFIEIIKVFKELTGDDTSNPANTDVNNSTISAHDKDISEEQFSEELSNGNFLRTAKEGEEVVNDTPVEPAKLAPKRNEKDKETSNKESDKKQQQFVKELLKNKYFWAWLKDVSATYLDIFMKKLDVVIKTEVGKQIEQYFTEHKSDNCKQDNIDPNNAVQETIQTSNVTDENVIGNISDTPIATDHNGLTSNDTTAESMNDSNEISSELSTKKHKDKPSEDKIAEKSVKIEAQNLFGSSVGSAKVTNIFIYNLNKEFDLDNIKPIKNGTNGVFVFGLDDKKPEEEENDTDKDKDTIPEVVTVKPDISSEHNKTEDQVIVTDENQNSTATLDTENEHQSYEKDKIEDKDQVNDQDNVEHSTDKSEVTPNDQTSTEANNDEGTTEIDEDEPAASSEKPLETIKDDKEKEATTEKETKEDLNYSEIDNSKEPAEVELDK